MTGPGSGGPSGDARLAPGRVDVRRLSSDECVVVGSGGRQWRIGASAEVLGGADGEAVLADLRAMSGPWLPPLRGQDDRVEMSADAVIARADRVMSGREDGHTVVFPFAGRWHRLRLTASDADRLVRTVLDCLRATVSDPQTAAALLRPAALADPHPGEAVGPVAPARPGTLERWTDGAWSPHPVTPAPLVDPLTGILHRVVRRRNESPLPEGFVHLHAELPYLESVDLRFRPDALAPAGALSGATPGSAELVEPGILSGVAHYCGADLGQGTRRRASAAQIARDGELWFDLRDWEPHDPALHGISGFPFAPFDPDRVGDWVRGHDEEGTVWVPLSLVHAGYLREGDEPAAATNANNLVGLQAGRSREEAIERACAHVVAHDAVAVWWSSTATAPEPPLPRLVREVFASCSLRVTVLAIPSTTDVPVRLAVVDDPAADIVSLGFSAHTDPDRAGELAVVEALIQHASARDLAAETSLIRDSADLGNGAVAGLAAFDPTRRYADAFAGGFRGLIDPMAHVQYGLDPRVVARTRARTHRAGHRGVPHADRISSVSARLRATARVVIIDVATDRVRSTDVHAVRVVVPGFARLQPAAFPLDPDGRLSRARAALGWQENRDPMPYPGW